VVKRRYEEQLRADREAYEANRARILEESKVAHAVALEEKRRLSRMQATRADFERMLLADQLAAYDTRLRLAKERAVREHRERKVATARRLLDEEEERQREEQELERERKEKEAQAQAERERYAAMRKKQQEDEEAERARVAEEERRRQQDILEREAERKRRLEDVKRRAEEEKRRGEVRPVGPPEVRPEESVWRRSVPPERVGEGVGAAEGGPGPAPVPEPEPEGDKWTRVGPGPRPTPAPAAESTSAPWRPSVASGAGGAPARRTKLDEWR
jgi:hypothetical protein